MTHSQSGIIPAGCLLILSNYDFGNICNYIFDIRQ